MLADIFVAKKLVPLFDSAYDDFGISIWAHLSSLADLSALATALAPCGMLYLVPNLLDADSRLGESCMDKSSILCARIWDLRYQGYATGDPTTDAIAIRTFAAKSAAAMPSMVVCQSYAKNMVRCPLSGPIPTIFGLF